MSKFFEKSFFLFAAIICFVLLIGSFLLWNQNQKLQNWIKSGNSYYPFYPLSEQEIIKYLKAIFPLAKSFEKISNPNENIYKAIIDNQVIGYAKIIEKDIPCPTCKDVKLICGIDTNEIVKKIILINEIDLRGVKFKMAKLELLLNQLIRRLIGKQGIFRITLIDEFLQQFYHKPVDDEFFQIGKNISVITGATESSYYITQGINELLASIKKINQKK